MAGGKATRFGRKVEKADLVVGGRTLLERARDALSVEGVDKVLVATAPHTPRTKVLSDSLGLETLDTPGAGFHEDIIDLLEELDRFVAMNVDVPFARSEHVRRLLSVGQDRSIATVLPAVLAVGVPDERSVFIDDHGERMIWVGLNLVTSSTEMDLLELDDPFLSVNINNDHDLDLANRLAAQYDRG